MYNGLKYFLAFSLGAAVGSIAAWKLLEVKTERMIQEEVDAFKEYWSKKDGEVISFDDLFESDDLTTESEKEYIKITEDYRSDEEGGSKSMDVGSRPYIISPDEFGENDDYETVSLTYYEDEVLADEMDELVEDVDDTVGTDSLTHFGEYEDDSVFVRNDRLKCDYEILKDNRTYFEVAGKDTNPEDDE